MELSGVGIWSSQLRYAARPKSLMRQRNWTS